MNVNEALKSRHSTRAFLPDPVKKDLLLEILEAALRTPSWGNTQPWEVYVAGGDVLETIRQGFIENYKNNVEGNLDIPRPESWPTSIQKRYKELFPLISEVAGERAKEFGDLNQKFFNAPAVIYLCMDKSLTSWSIFDLGAFSQSIMLEAAERGLETMPAVMLVHYPNVIRSNLDIPDNLAVVFGIAIGHEDKEHPINEFKSPRRPLSDVARFEGI